jgi:hypothetical protein
MCPNNAKYVSSTAMNVSSIDIYVSSNAIYCPNTAIYVSSAAMNVSSIDIYIYICVL